MLGARIGFWAGDKMVIWGVAKRRNWWYVYQPSPATPPEGLSGSAHASAAQACPFG